MLVLPWLSYDGLDLCWTMGFKSDAQEVLNLILPSSNILSPMSNLIPACRSLSKRCWDISIQSVPREANQSADCLAKNSYHQDELYKVPVDPPIFVLLFLEKDQRGSHPSLCCHALLNSCVVLVCLLSIC